MPPILTVFATSPARGQGLARDMRVRWALEELSVAYDVQLLTFTEMKQPAHLARNPFSQIPTWQEGDRTLFESGAIVLHLAEQHPGLLLRDPDARMRAIMWVFAALNTVPPPSLSAPWPGCWSASSRGTHSGCQCWMSGFGRDWRNYRHGWPRRRGWMAISAWAT